MNEFLNLNEPYKISSHTYIIEPFVPDPPKLEIKSAEKAVDKVSKSGDSAPKHTKLSKTSRKGKFS